MLSAACAATRWCADAVHPDHIHALTVVMDLYRSDFRAAVVSAHPVAQLPRYELTLRRPSTLGSTFPPTRVLSPLGPGKLHGEEPATLHGIAPHGRHVAFLLLEVLSEMSDKLGEEDLSGAPVVCPLCGQVHQRCRFEAGSLSCTRSDCRSPHHRPTPSLLPHTEAPQPASPHPSKDNGAVT